MLKLICCIEDCLSCCCCVSSCCWCWGNCINFDFCCCWSCCCCWGEGVLSIFADWGELEYGKGDFVVLKFVLDGDVVDFFINCVLEILKKYLKDMNFYRLW